MSGPGPAPAPIQSSIPRTILYTGHLAIGIVKWRSEGTTCVKIFKCLPSELALAGTLFAYVLETITRLAFHAMTCCAKKSREAFSKTNIAEGYPFIIKAFFCPTFEK